MSDVSDDFAVKFAEVVRVKAAWRKHAQAMTWEEKVAAVERMWERDAQLKKAREGNKDERKRPPPP